MRRRIFIAINLDSKTKEFVHKRTENFLLKSGIKEIKMTPQDNYHLTLAFLGYVDDDQTGIICQNLNQSLQGIEAFDLSLNEFFWGPKPEKPKMLWLRGEKNDQLMRLRQLVETAVFGNKTDKKAFSPHISLGRLTQLAQKNMTEIKEKINILVPVSKVEVLESVLEGGKRKYFMVDEIELA